MSAAARAFHTQIPQAAIVHANTGPVGVYLTYIKRHIFRKVMSIWPCCPNITGPSYSFTAAIAAAAWSHRRGKHFHIRKDTHKRYIFCTLVCRPQVTSRNTSVRADYLHPCFRKCDRNPYLFPISPWRKGGKRRNIRSNSLRALTPLRLQPYSAPRPPHQRTDPGIHLQMTLP